MGYQFRIQMASRDALTNSQRNQIISLCSIVFDMDSEPVIARYGDAVHLLGWYGDVLVSHALRYTRWLQIGSGPYLRTAYVEEVVTDEAFRGRGYATQIVRLLLAEAAGSDLAALSPANRGFYERMGWMLWRGPLSIRTESGLQQCSSDKEVMVYPLPNTPTLDLSKPLSAEWREGELW